MPSQPSHIPREYKIVILGAGGVGKSALTIRFVRSYFIEEYDPTIEDSYLKTCMIDNEEASLDVLDSAGQEEYSVMREQYMRSGHGFILVYSISSRTSFDEIRLLADQLLRVKDVTQAPLVIVGNKCDLEDQREVTTEEGRQLATEYQAMFLESSAKTRTNVDEAFYQAVRQIRHYRFSAQHSDRSSRRGTITNGSGGQGNSGNSLVQPAVALLAKTKSLSKRSHFSLGLFGSQHGGGSNGDGHRNSRSEARISSPASTATTQSTTATATGPESPPSLDNESDGRVTAKTAYLSESRRRATLSKENSNHEDNSSRCCTIF